MKKHVCVMSAAGFGLGAAAYAGQALTYVDLVGRLTDLEAPAALPEPGEACVLASSYDRE